MELHKYRHIDAIRGYAILGVFLVHCSLFYPSSIHFISFFQSLGRFGVQLFYLASAITLCISWNSRSSNEKSPYKNYFTRRFFRIAPLFYLALLFYLFMDGLNPRFWAPTGINFWTIFSTFFFLNGFHPETINSIVPGQWSIAVEMNFYLLLPFFMRFITTSKKVIFLIFIIFR